MFLPRHSPSPAHLSRGVNVDYHIKFVLFFFCFIYWQCLYIFQLFIPTFTIFLKKKKLLQLPEPLILYRYYTDIIGLSKECQRVIVEEADTHPVPQAGEKSDLSTQLNKVIYRIRDLLYQLPTNNYRTLRHLIAHLRR